MGLPAREPASYEDLLDLPENLVGEIINGRLVTHPHPTPKHARAYSSLGIKIGSPYDHGNGGPGGWWIVDEPELHLERDILVPDLAVRCTSLALDALWADGRYGLPSRRRRL